MMYLRRTRRRFPVFTAYSFTTKRNFMTASSEPQIPAPRTIPFLSVPQDIPATMTAIVQTDPTDPSSLAPATVPTPTPGAGEALIRVAAAGVNRADVLQAQGHYPPPPGITDIIGLEAAGTIVAFGPETDAPAGSATTEPAATPGDTAGATIPADSAQPAATPPSAAPSASTWKIGDHCGVLLAGGGYAEYVVAPIGQLTPVPAGWDAGHTAGIVEVATTVWSNLGMVGGLAAGKKVLIHGGTGGIGTFAIQLVNQLGATAVTTCGSAEGAAHVLELGAARAVNYREESFVDTAKELGGFDLILDIMGAKYLADNVRALGEKGHLIIIGLQGGVKAELNINALLVKRASITATSLRGRSVDDKCAVVADTVRTVWPLLSDGRITSQMNAVFPLAEAAAAHRALVKRAVTGKIVLAVGSE